VIKEANEQNKNIIGIKLGERLFEVNWSDVINLYKDSGD